LKIIEESAIIKSGLTRKYATIRGKEIMDKKYTIGLDIGTTSVGWAVVDDDFNLVQGKKKIIEIDTDGTKRKRSSRTNLWGVRLFDEGKTAADTRLKRGSRRRLARRKKRLNYLREIFHGEITKFDESFFIRMDESFYQNGDDIKSIKTQYPFFNEVVGSGESYPDEKEYYKKYPTIYHLRQRLIDNPEQADLRLVYLALHHILKFRGHFVNQGQKFDLKNINVSENLRELLVRFNELSIAGLELDISKETKANEILTNRTLSKSKKAFDLTEIYSLLNNEQNFEKYDQGTKAKTTKFLKAKDTQQKALYTAIVGNSINLASIFAKDEYKEKDAPQAVKLKYSDETFDDKLMDIESHLSPEEFEIIGLGKKIYEAVVLSNILTQETLSASMIEKFDLHKKQLAELKDFTKSHSYDFYTMFFKADGIYTKYIEGVGNPQKRTSREDFYNEIKKAFEAEFKFTNLKFPNAGKEIDLTDAESLTDKQKIFIKNLAKAMEFENYLPKQRMSDNGAIPYQVHEHELVEIINSQKAYYPFLGEKIAINNEGKKQVDEYKIQTLMKFRIPYYVGPLIQANNGTEGNKTTDRSRFAWMQKKSDEKITPWNFDQVVDKEESAVKFIERMTSFCTYLPNEKVLSKKSLLYQEFTIYNELIIGGWYNGGTKCYFPPELRKKIVNRLFKKTKKVTAKAMIDFLNAEENLNLESPKQLFGIDTFVRSPSYNTTYSTFIDLINAGIPEQMIEDNRKKFEEIIKWQTIFEDSDVLKKRIKKANEDWNALLSQDQIKKLSKKHYTGWGRLSGKLLNEITAINGKTIIENLKEEKYNNFMRLIEDERIIEEIKKDQVGEKDIDTLHYGMVRDLAGSPAIKKGIWQSLQIISELEEYLGKEKIGKIVVEMARENSEGRSTSRAKQIENFYKNFREKTGEEISSELKKEHENQADDIFSNEKVFLYFLQNAKCMYSGASLELSDLSSYEVDHIIPQTYIKDDSFDNKVLVLKTENQNKGGDVPHKDIVRKMRDYWELLAKNGQVSPRKFANLTKGSLGDKEKEGFINRQLVETRQITKHIANILSSYFKETGIEILTPKSSLTSQFREGIVYVPKEEFDVEKTMNDNMIYEVAGLKILPNGETLASKYSNSNFFKVHFHEGFKKNRDINDYHHAHDAYLNAVVATYIYKTRPDLKKMWVYGEYQRKSEGETGKWGSQRKNFFRQLLTGMIEEVWEGFDLETGEVLEFWKRDEVLGMIERNLKRRNMNIVKKTEVQNGKFGDESIFKKDERAIGVKKNLSSTMYGGTKSPISAFTVLVKTTKGEIKPMSIPAMVALEYEKTANKVEFLKELYPKAKIEMIVVEKVPKYTHFITSKNAHRLVASYKEGQSVIQLPMMTFVSISSTTEEIYNAYILLSNFIKKNKLFTEIKLPLLDTTIKENFYSSSVDEQIGIIEEMMSITKGSNQGLKALQKAGLGTTSQQLRGNIITNDSILIYKSITGLFETRRKI